MANVDGSKSAWKAPRTSSEVDLFASQLQISKAKVAEIVGLHPSALSRDRLSAASRGAFDPILTILNRATAIAGEEDHAVSWFKHEPIVSMGTLSAMEHVANGTRRRCSRISMTSRTASTPELARQDPIATQSSFDSSRPAAPASAARLRL